MLIYIKKLTLTLFTLFTLLGNTGKSLHSYPFYPPLLSKGVKRVKQTGKTKKGKKTDPLEPTCQEESEALRAAPPWKGFWLAKPTCRQRVMLWVRYARYRWGKSK